MYVGGLGGVCVSQCFFLVCLQQWRHEVGEHLGLRRRTCPFCGKRYAQLDFQRHLQTLGVEDCMERLETDGHSGGFLVCCFVFLNGWVCTNVAFDQHGVCRCYALYNNKGPG